MIQHGKNLVVNGFAHRHALVFIRYNSDFTMTFKLWDVVVVPFPFVDKKVSKPRPALVLSDIDFNIKGLVILSMITTAGKTSHPFDIEIRDLTTTGLPLPSVVRWKIFSLDRPLIKNIIGYLSKTDREECNKILQTIFSN